MFRCLRLIYLLVLFPLALPAVATAAASQPLNSESMLDEKRLQGLVNAPDFPAHLEWLNTGRPLSLADLKGKIVLLDFWTYCCINCMHVIPDLKKLEAKYPKELVVIGVHSAKFQNEKDTQQIRQAILRYEIEHPVLNDYNMEVWDSYSVHAWPTLVLINPNGRIVGLYSGEDIFDLFDALIGETIQYFDARGELDRRPVNLSLEKGKQPQSVLAFPGKVHADKPGRRLFITDSNHNRILVTDPEGKIIEVIGSGRSGNKDGSFEEAQLNHPQGTFLDGQTLYIADTENHLIRAADLAARKVSTLFGSGKKAHEIGARGKAKNVDLNSPWDLLAHEGKLYIAMAGSHQLYAADLKTLEIGPHAGSGQEARLDGPLKEAALAQPSGIATDGTRLYFADSEVSSVRAADMDPAGRVETLIGEDLFVFGDVDGPRPVARLQHPLGTAWRDGQIYVADTYNSKIKVIDPKKKTSATFAGTGKHAENNGPRLEAGFNEPGGLAFLDGTLYVADTNNHLIRTLDLQTGSVGTLQLSGLERLARRTMKEFRGREVRLKPAAVRPGEVEITVNFILPPGYKWTAQAPVHLEWQSANPAALKFLKESGSVESRQIQFPFTLPAAAGKGSAEISITGVVYYCRQDSTLCFFDSVRLIQPLTVEEAGAPAVKLETAVEVRGKDDQ